MVCGFQMSGYGGDGIPSWASMRACFARQDTRPWSCRVPEVGDRPRLGA